jgi:hypothetical protein
VKKILEVQNFLATRFVRLVLAGLSMIIDQSTANMLIMASQQALQFRNYRISEEPICCSCRLQSAFKSKVFFVMSQYIIIHNLPGVVYVLLRTVLILPNNKTKSCDTVSF